MFEIIRVGLRGLVLGLEIGPRSRMVKVQFQSISLNYKTAPAGCKPHSDIYVLVVSYAFSKASRTVIICIARSNSTKWPTICPHSF